jgi:hypothetical protein
LPEGVFLISSTNCFIKRDLYLETGDIYKKSREGNHMGKKIIGEYTWDIP